MHKAAVDAWGHEDYARRLGSDWRALQALASLQHVMREKSRVANAIEMRVDFEPAPLPEGVYFPDSRNEYGYLALRLFDLATAADLHHGASTIRRLTPAGLRRRLIRG